MKRQQPYEIKLVGLRSGIYHYDFKIENEFLDLFEQKLINQVVAEFHLSLEKQNESNFNLEVHLKGNLIEICDRCTDEVNLTIQSHQFLMIKLLDEKSDSGDENIWYLPSNTVFVNFANYFYELITLSKPLRITCELDKNRKQCNSKVNEILEDLAPSNNKNKNKNKENPIWDKLKEINFDN